MATLSKSDLFDVLVEFSEQKQQFIESEKTGSDAPASISFSLEALLCACQNVEKIQDESPTLDTVQEDVKEVAKKAQTELIWAMIQENQDADDGPFSKADIESDLYDWFKKLEIKTLVPLPSNIVEQLRLANPYNENWGGLSGTREYEAWVKSVSKLRELLSSQPVQGNEPENKYKLPGHDETMGNLDNLTIKPK